MSYKAFRFRSTSGSKSLKIKFSEIWLHRGFLHSHHCWIVILKNGNIGILEHFVTLLPFHRATVRIQMRQVWQDSCGFESFSNLIYGSGPAEPSLDIIRMWYLDFELEIWKSDNLKIRFQNVWKSNWFTSLTFCGTWTKFNYANHDFHGNRSNLFSWFLSKLWSCYGIIHPNRINLWEWEKGKISSTGSLVRADLFYWDCLFVTLIWERLWKRSRHVT